MNENLKIEKSLEKARAWVEALAQKDWGVRDTTGYCAIASTYLYKTLKSLGFRPKIVESIFYESGHCYILLNNMILDVTADQFGGPKIASVEASRDDLPYYWDSTNVYKIYDNLVSFYAATGPRSPWPHEQQPRTFRKYFKLSPEEI